MAKSIDTADIPTFNNKRQGFLRGGNLEKLDRYINLKHKLRRGS